MHEGMTAEPPPERVVARLRPHARRLVRPAVTVVLVTVAGGFGFGVFRAQLVLLNAVVAGLVLVLLVVGGVVPLVRWMSQRYVVTTRRLVVVQGLGTRTRRELLHSRGYDVTVRRRGLQGVFRSGDVLVFPGDDPALVLADVPHADLVVAVLHDLVESYEARRRHREPDWDEIVGGGQDRPQWGDVRG